MKLTDDKLNELEQKALKATPGKRHCVSQDPEWKTPLQIIIAVEEWREYTIATESYPNNAEHIAAFDPTTCLALIRELRAAREVIKAGIKLERLTFRNVSNAEEIIYFFDALARYRGT